MSGIFCLVMSSTNSFFFSSGMQPPSGLLKFGGFVLWVQLNKKVNAFKLRTEAMKHNISIVPGKIFSASCDHSNCIRISFGKPWDDDADYGLMMLGKLIHKMI